MPKMLEMETQNGWLNLHRLNKVHLGAKRAPVFRIETGDRRGSSFDDLPIEQLREIGDWIAQAIAEEDATIAA